MAQVVANFHCIDRAANHRLLSSTFGCLKWRLFNRSFVAAGPSKEPCKTGMPGHALLISSARHKVRENVGWSHPGKDAGRAQDHCSSREGTGRGQHPPNFEQAEGRRETLSQTWWNHGVGEGGPQGPSRNYIGRGLGAIAETMSINVLDSRTRFWMVGPCHCGSTLDLAVDMMMQVKLVCGIHVLCTIPEILAAAHKLIKLFCLP